MASDVKTTMSTPRSSTQGLGLTSLPQEILLQIFRLLVSLPKVTISHKTFAIYKQMTSFSDLLTLNKLFAPIILEAFYSYSNVTVAHVPMPNHVGNFISPILLPGSGDYARENIRPLVKRLEVRLVKGPLMKERRWMEGVELLRRLEEVGFTGLKELNVVFATNDPSAPYRIEFEEILREVRWYDPFVIKVKVITVAVEGTDLTPRSQDVVERIEKELKGEGGELTEEEKKEIAWVEKSSIETLRKHREKERKRKRVQEEKIKIEAEKRRKV